jgi:hypothetical protein
VNRPLVLHILAKGANSIVLDLLVKVALLVMLFGENEAHFASPWNEAAPLWATGFCILGDKLLRCQHFFRFFFWPPFALAERRAFGLGRALSGGPRRRAAQTRGAGAMAESPGASAIGRRFSPTPRLTPCAAPCTILRMDTTSFLFAAHGSDASADAGSAARKLRAALFASRLSACATLLSLIGRITPEAA